MSLENRFWGATKIHGELLKLGIQVAQSTVFDLWFAATRNPTAEWLARQITEAFPWDSAPKYLIRDNDRAFGVAFKARVRVMGIRDRPTSYRSSWQNGYVERFDRLDPARVHRSFARVQRRAPSTNPFEICFLLQ